MAEFVMPSLGADMEAGTLVEWLKKPGETVKRGDVIAVVETQKGAIEVEGFDDGVLETYLVDLGTRVPVGTPLAVIRKDGEEAAAAKPAPKPAEAPAGHRRNRRKRSPRSLLRARTGACAGHCDHAVRTAEDHAGRAKAGRAEGH